MKNTTQVRANLKVDDALILEWIREKENNPIGKILAKFLADSPKWVEAKKKLALYKEDF